MLDDVVERHYVESAGGANLFETTGYDFQASSATHLGGFGIRFHSDYLPSNCNRPLEKRSVTASNV
nr:hypothetical protein [Ramlibacter monticola]